MGTSIVYDNSDATLPSEPEIDDSDDSKRKPLPINEWIPPFGDANGLRLVQNDIDIPKDCSYLEMEKEQFALPSQHGDYIFIIAKFGTEDVILIAFDRNSGSLNYFDPDVNKWVAMKCKHKNFRLAPHKLPDWSWAAAVSAKSEFPGFAVPTVEGPVWLDLDFKENQFTPVYENKKGKCVGGAASLKDKIVIPIVDAEGVSVRGFDFKGQEWRQIGKPVHVDCNETEESLFFSVSVVDKNRNFIYWIGFSGLFSYDVLNNSCQWRLWKTGKNTCNAVPEMGPPYKDDMGKFWQICYDQQDDSFRYYQINGDEGAWEEVDGGRFSSGFSCFSRYYDFWEKPWAKIDTHIEEKAESFRAPLLCLNEQTKQTVTVAFGKDSDMAPLIAVKDLTNKYSVTLQIESPDAPSIRLDKSEVLARQFPWNLRLFIYGQCLYAYKNAADGCYKWRLK